MPAYTAEKGCSTFAWICCFVICIFISLYPLDSNIPARCFVQSIVADPPASPQDDLCSSPVLNVRVDGENFTAYYCFFDCKSLLSNYTLNRTLGKDCWTDRGREPPFYCFSSPEVFSEIRKAASSFRMISVITTLMSVVFGVLFLISVSSIFKPEIIQFSPPWLLTFVTNISSRITRYQPESQPLRYNDTVQSLRMPQPPRSTASSTRRGIRDLVETTKLSDQAVKDLEDEGWSCCICLGERQGDDGKLLSVSRLSCGHATHSECLQSWLEKGRAVCPLCNTDVFRPNSKATTSSRSTAAGHHGEREDSTDVGRTEGAPSPAGDSMRIDVPQRQPTVPTPSVDPGEQIDRPSR